MPDATFDDLHDREVIPFEVKILMPGSTTGKVHSDGTGAERKAGPRMIGRSAESRRQGAHARCPWSSRLLPGREGMCRQADVRTDGMDPVMGKVGEVDETRDPARSRSGLSGEGPDLPSVTAMMADLGSESGTSCASRMLPGDPFRRFLARLLRSRPTPRGSRRPCRRRSGGWSRRW